MPISPIEFENMRRRVEAARKRPLMDDADAIRAEFQEEPEDACIREIGKGGLHEQIMKHCDAQWPRWKYVHHRTDKASGIQEGCPDFTIALPNSRVIWVEAKARGKKLLPKQRDWKHELEMLKQHYALVFSMSDFENAVNQLLK